MKKISVFVSIILCISIIANTTFASAVSINTKYKTDAFTVDVVHGIVAGEKLKINAFSDGTLLDYVSLTSSNPSVISCSPGGYITGEKAGESADITCTFQDGSRKTFTVYCVRAVYPQEECTTNSLHNQIYAQPKNGKLVSIHLNLNILSNFLFWFFQRIAELGRLIAIITPNSLQPVTTGKFKVYGQYGNYAYIRFDDDPSSDGFISYDDLNKKFDEFLYISDSTHTVKVGEQDAYLTADYYENVTWEVENDNIDGKIDYDNSIIKFDPKTGKITAKKGGVTSIRATANGMGRTCDIVSIYMWPQEWKVTAAQNITLYERPDIVDINYEINEGDTFWVVGDLGGSNSWCYINRGSQAFPEYSYAKIEDFSTKGTISQYNELGWIWPVVTPENKNKANFISSPYGERDREPTMHKGIDITTGITGEIKGYEVVSAFSGKVIYKDYTTSTGYCVGIQSDKKDPITGEKMVAFYMHLIDSAIVYHGDSVSAGEIIGYVGNTGNSGGYHLHFEVNNKNASIGDGSTARNYYAYLINPLFFFTNSTNNYIIGVESDKRKEGNENKIIIDKNCSTVLNHFGAYWYGDDKKED